MLENEVKKVLEPIQYEIENIVTKAWQDYRDLTDSVIFKRTRANIVWDRMVSRALKWSEEEPLTRTIIKNNTVCFVIDNKLLFRFKKGDSLGYSNNVQTKLALAYHDPQKVLPGISSTHRVDVVYMLNPLETEVEDICVVSRTHNVVNYIFSIKGSNSVEVPKIQPQYSTSKASITKLKKDVIEKSNIIKEG